MQKSVRRGKAAAAARACAHLAAEAGPLEALRRLAVVCIEDALLHPALPALTWLIAACSKGYTLGPEVCAFMVRFAAELAAVAVKDGADFFAEGRRAAGEGDCNASAEEESDRNGGGGGVQAKEEEVGWVQPPTRV